MSDGAVRLKSKKWNGNIVPFTYFSAIVVLFVFMHEKTFRWLYSVYTGGDTYYSHGFLVPFVTAYLIWSKRDRLREIPANPSSVGLLLVILSLVIHVGSSMLFMFSMSALSILFLIFGLSLYFRGWDFARELFYPWLFLFFMIPLPWELINSIAVPLKLLVASISASIVSFVGMAIYRTGYFIETAKGNLVIDNPCSGLRSIIAFMALGYLLAYMAKCSKIKKILIFSAAVPTAIFTNILRVIFLIVMVNYYGPSMADPSSLPHDVSGYMVFVLGGAMLLFIGNRCEK